MSGMNISPISLLGRVVSFKDLAFERQLLDSPIPPDYPKEFLSSVRTGLVTEFAIRLPLHGNVIAEILIDDNYYDLSDCEFLDPQLRTKL